MTLIHGRYEYAGFLYSIEEDEKGRMWATPHKDQHRAAWKDKHKRAAISCFNDDYKWDQRT